MTARRLLVAAVALVALGSACPDRTTSTAGVAWADSDATTPCPKLSSAGRKQGSRPKNGKLTLTPVASVKFSSELSSLSLSSRYLVYTQDDKRLVVCDLDRGKIAVLFTDPRTKPSGPILFGRVEAIIYGRGSQSTVAYVTFIEPAPRTSSWGWTIESTDVATGRHQRWDAGHADYEHLPEPAVDWPWLAWRESRGGGYNTPPTYTAVWTVDLRSGRKRRIAEATEIGDVAVSQGKVFFDNLTADPSGRQLFRIPADGSAPPVQLTHQGRVRGLAAGNGRIVWLSDKPGTSGEHWTMPATGSSPVKLAPGVTHPRPGPDFLLDAPFVLDLLHADARVSSVGDQSVVDGNLIAWVTLDDPKHPHESTRQLRIVKATRTSPP